MILPICSELSISLCAAAASARGKVLKMMGLSLPASSSGQISRLKAEAIAPFLLDRAGAQRRAGDGEPLHHHHAEIDLGQIAALQSNDHGATLDRQRRDIARHIGAADHVKDEIDTALLRRLLHHLDEILGLVIDGAGGAELLAGLALRLAAAVTKISFAPKSLAIWIAVVPIPELPPWISTLSPA